jgi:hypothetical protein
MIQEMQRPLTTAEEESRKSGNTWETIVEGRTWNNTEGRIWNKRPDGLGIEIPTSGKSEEKEFVILELT